MRADGCPLLASKTTGSYRSLDRSAVACRFANALGMGRQPSSRRHLIRPRTQSAVSGRVPIQFSHGDAANWPVSER